MSIGVTGTDGTDRAAGADPARREETDVAKRGEALELAVLGLLHESPMHGYELRKRVTACSGGAGCCRTAPSTRA